MRTDFYTSLGANPIFMSFSDLYEAMDRGTVDVIGDMAYVISNAFKLQEVVKCMYANNPPGFKGNGGSMASGFYMNKKKFDSFPKETQKMFMDLRREYGVLYAQTLTDDEDSVRKDWQAKYNVTFNYATPEDQKFILEAGNKANEAMIKKQEASGAKGAREVWDYYLKARKKHEAARVKK